MVTDDPSDIDILDIQDDQWEQKKYKIEFINGDGSTVEIWAEEIKIT